MNRFEYLIVSLPTFEGARKTQGHSPSVDLLNRQGGEGWEAVGMSTLADSSVAVLLKRPVPAAQDLDARADTGIGVTTDLTTSRNKSNGDPR
jgi:hypothetical protein